MILDVDGCSRKIEMARSLQILVIPNLMGIRKRSEESDSKVSIWSTQCHMRYVISGRLAHQYLFTYVLFFQKYCENFEFAP